jgi:hypothetical protein
MNVFVPLNSDDLPPIDLARADRRFKVLVNADYSLGVGHRNSKSKSGFGSSLEDFDLKAAKSGIT